MTEDSKTAAGLEAYKHQDWVEAHGLLISLLESSEAAPEALEALGSAAWWIGEIETTITARQRAYADYAAEGRSIDAARVAIQVAEDHMLLLQSSTANGWLSKARTLLDGISVVPEHGHLMRFDGVLASNLKEAIDLSAKVQQIGVELGDIDLETLGLHDGGRFLVASGEVERGMTMMEEAMIGAVAGELSPKVTGRIFCNMIETSASMADYRSAIEWSDQTMRWCDGMGSAGGYPGVCRVRRAQFMRLRGAWSDAEQEARRAVGDLAHVRPYMGEAFDELGMVRLNLGDLTGAEEAFRQSHSLGSSSMPGLALVRLAQGEASEALSMIQSSLGSSEGLTARMKLLPSAVEIALGASDLAAAEQHASELEDLAQSHDSDVWRAFSLVSAGRVAAAKNEPGEAVHSFQDAVPILMTCGLPFEVARVRAELGSALIQSGSESLGRLEIDDARAGFERLGATLELDRLSETPTPSEPIEEMATMLFTDIVSSTDLVRVMGDESWANLIAWHDRTIRSLIEKYLGVEVDHSGDGFFISFSSPTKALECAKQIQTDFERHRKQEGFSPHVRMGIHTGQVLAADDGLVGHQVHVAARVGAAAEGDEVLVTVEVMEQTDGFVFDNERTIEAKGVKGPLMVASLVWKV